MRLPLLGAVTLLLRVTCAVFADEAFNTDYHFALLGLPKEETTFFHQPDPNSRASLIYTLSQEGVIGALNPRDGSIVWRQQLLANAHPSNASFLRAGEGQDVVVGGIGSQVTAWSAADGRLAWSSNVPGPVEDLEILELSDGSASAGAKDAIVLTSGNHPAVQRLDATTGALKWTHNLDSGDAPYQVSASATEVFAILLHKTILGYIKIKVISLDPVSGRKNDEYTLSSDNELASAETIVSVGANSASPIIAWTDTARSVLKVNVVGSKNVASFDINSKEVVQKVRVHAPFHTNSLAHFLVHFETGSGHWAEVFHINLADSTIEKAYSLPKVSGRGAFSTSTANANVFFTRVTDSEVLTVSSVSHGILGKWPITSFGVDSMDAEHVEPIHAESEISVKDGGVSALRSAILLSTGDWILLREGSAVWRRPEMLASTISASFANSAEVQAFAQELEIESHSNPISAYVHRVSRHIQDIAKLPEVLALLPQRISNGLFGTTADSGLASDVFGFHKVIACVTKNGRVVGLDAGYANRILWSTAVVDPKPGFTWNPSLTSTPEGVFELTLGGSQGLPGWKINASTGGLVTNTPAAKPDVSLPDAVIFTVKDNEVEASKPGSVGALWHFVPSKGEQIVSINPRPVNDPVASIGKVLGDRRVLYKYLSPNLALLVTANDATKAASFYVLDTVSGATLYSNIHTDVDLAAPIPSIMSENWFAYSYTAETAESAPKGHYLIVGEMFESLIPNDRGPLSASSNVSSLQAPAEPFVLLRSYQIPETISKLSVTQTRQGITSRQLLAVLTDSNSIVGIPYGAIDPRRPIGRDPTKDEQMEGLMRYAPTLEFDPKWSLNHAREVLGIKDVITAPALIESTSLVFAYGLDIFGTRLSPSFSFDILGKDFNKFQMLATVAALAVATLVVAPLVARKQINARWEFT